MIAGMRELFDCWTEVSSRLRSARSIALFLDFDGTLARLRPRPEEVWLDAFARQTLSALARSPRFRVWVISGRRQADIRARIHVPGVRYLGLHGWEKGPGAGLTERSSSSLACIKSLLGGALVNNPGMWIEDKGLVLTVHYRDATAHSQREVRRILRRAVAPFEELLRIAGGKHVWEIVPRELEDKGAAVKQELASLPCPATPVYVGDDLGDEPAFAALKRGITVYVGRLRRTRARYHLADVGRVRSFLQRLQTEFA
jgi:trehalose-phosphatase